MKRVVLALLPLAVFTQNFRELFFLAGVTTLALWGSAVIFKSFRRFVPSPVLRWIPIFWTVLLGVGGTKAGLLLYGLPSFYLLWSEDLSETLHCGLWFWALAGLLGVLFLWTGPLPAPYLGILFAAAFGFLLLILEKKSEAVFLTGVSVVFFLYGNHATDHDIFGALRLISLTVLFSFLMTGLAKRLVFSPVPPRLAGLPILLLSACLLALALAGWAQYATL